MKRKALGIFLKGAGMGAADAVPGVSGGTIAFEVQPADLLFMLLKPSL